VLNFCDHLLFHRRLCLSEDDALAFRGQFEEFLAKFHQLFLKYANENRRLKNELDKLKEPTSKQASNNIHRLEKKVSLPLNIGNLSLADLDLNHHDESDDNNDGRDLHQEEDSPFGQLKDDELECFNDILTEFHTQIHELVLKEDSLRREIGHKTEELHKGIADFEEMKQQKIMIAQDLNRINEYKALVNSVCLNSDEVSPKDIAKKQEILNNLNVNYEEFCDDKVKKLIDENNFYKITILKMKDDAFKLENEITQLENEIENFEKFKKFILTKNIDIEKKTERCSKGIRTTES